MRVPFCPMPVEKASKMLGNSLYGLAQPLLKIMPSFDLELAQAGFEISALDYLSIAIFSALFMTLVIFVPVFFAAMMMVAFWKAFSISFLVAILMGAVTFIYIKIYPKLLVKKRLMDIDRNLIFALRHMYVQITSGVPVYDALSSVASGNYGSISAEFRKVIKNVNTGMSLENALEDMTRMNPSHYLRRSMWQISNSVNTGSDLGTVVRSIIDYLSAEQRIMIKRYGSQLNPLTLAYMMVAVIMPSLGVTFLIVLSSFSKLPITETMFWIILGGLALFQFMFLGIIKSKRPNLV